MRPDQDRINAPLEEKIFYIIEALLNADDPQSRAQSTLLTDRIVAIESRLKGIETSQSKSDLGSVKVDSDIDRPKSKHGRSSRKDRKKKSKKSRDRSKKS
jgi:hypothetical protein